MPCDVDIDQEDSSLSLTSIHSPHPILPFLRDCVVMKTTHKIETSLFEASGMARGQAGG
jgi:hypothetical protein